MDETTINSIVNGPKASKEAESLSPTKSKRRKSLTSPSKTTGAAIGWFKPFVSDPEKMKMLLYKFFFFNYVLQVSGSDIIESLTTAQVDNPLVQFGENLASLNDDQPVNY